MAGDNDAQNLILYMMSLSPAERLQQMKEITDPEGQVAVEEINRCLYRYSMRQDFAGWLFDNNPFLELDLSYRMQAISEDILNATHELVYLANLWIQTGIWRVAEDYYKAALSLAFASNNVVVGLLLAANLSVCYLLGLDTYNAMQLINHALPISIQAKDWATLYRLGTVKRMCLLRKEQWAQVGSETQSLRILKPELASLDPVVLEIGNNAYQSLRAQERLKIWQHEWKMLDQRKG